MRTDHRWLVVVAGNAVFLFLISQVNHHLTNFSLFGLAHGQTYLFLPGLPLAFTALRLNLRPAIVATVATAIALEAVVPVQSGVILLPATACVCVAISLRAGFNRFEPSTAIITALLMNLVLILAVTIAAYRAGGVSLSRVALDLLFSQLAVALITAWFFAAQTALLELFGFSIDTELRESV